MAILTSETEADSINLTVPNPPDSVKYPDLEDWRHKKLLEMNGVALQEDAVTRILTDGAEVLQVSAAHTAGSMKFASAVPALERLAGEQDDLIQVESAYALVRLGKTQARETLEKCLAYPLNAYLCPPVAAGYLARLDDAQGFPIIVAGQQQELSTIRMMSCKQLYFFMPFHGSRDDKGQTRDVLAQFERALQDPEQDIQWQAMTQLREIQSPEAHALLERYASRKGNQK